MPTQYKSFKGTIFLKRTINSELPQTQGTMLQFKTAELLFRSVLRLPPHRDHNDRKKAEASVPKPLSAWTVCEPYNDKDVTDLLEQNERLRAEIEKVKQHYKEMFESINDTRTSTTEKTFFLVIPSTGVSSSTRASGSKPRSNTKHNRILPAKSVNNKKVEDHPRTNKSVWTKVNRMIYKVKLDEYGDVLKNKARLDLQWDIGQEEGMILKIGLL
ncbi:hypothetical protein Tco_0924111 [Tanacetum coccineum]|uniref:Uncharacterized protein n=1 Tax=Tanacetum coccineum TaxID=301880 RepID=A0ABQ5D5M0_9ASTR